MTRPAHLFSLAVGEFKQHLHTDKMSAMSPTLVLHTLVKSVTSGVATSASFFSEADEDDDDDDDEEHLREDLPKSSSTSEDLFTQVSSVLISSLSSSLIQTSASCLCSSSACEEDEALEDELDLLLLLSSVGE